MQEYINITPIVAQELYINWRGWVPESLPVSMVNRLLYWGDMVLFNYQRDDGHSDGSELGRNLTLIIDLIKLVKKYPRAEVDISFNFVKASLQESVMAKYEPPSTKREPVESTEKYEVVKETSTRHLFYIKTGTLPRRATIEEVFKMYVESPLPTSTIRQLEQGDEPMKFTFIAPGTNYQITFLLGGKIRKIEVVNTAGYEITTGQILDMCRWANSELKDIVRKAVVCRKIEPEAGHDAPEPIMVCDT